MSVHLYVRVCVTLLYPKTLWKKGFDHLFKKNKRIAFFYYFLSKVQSQELGEGPRIGL